MFKISQEVCNVFTKLAIRNLYKPRNLDSLGSFHTNIALKCESKANEETEEGEETPRKQIDPLKDRTKVIPVETSIRYLKSAAYKETYGDQFVWEQYRRNHKGLFPPRKTRKTCVRAGVISTGNPCPICRDEYLVLDHQNTDLLQQFISPHTGQILSYTKTGLCQKSHLNLQVAIHRAWDYGLLSFQVPFREYDYTEYYTKEELQKANFKVEKKQ